MILDSLLELSKAQALTATGNSTNVIDLQQTARQVGAGRQLYAVFQVDVAADNTTEDETYSLAVITSAADNLSNPVTLASRAPAAELLTKGSRFVIPLPPDGMLRYLAARYTLGGTTPSVTLSCWITDQEPPSWQGYPAN